jgi:ubiquinone/menaquinone biosynthesis C-methylase UbiE
MLEHVDVKFNHIKILDVGGGAGMLGKLVLEHFKDRGVEVTFIALDLSSEMLKIQKKNNPDIATTWCCTLQECPENDFDLVLMIDVIEHIPDKDSAAEALNKISRYILYNIPIQINLFDLLRNCINKFTYYSMQTKLLGHVHFFTPYSALRFLKNYHTVVIKNFKPYCFMMLKSLYPSYVELRKSKLRLKEVQVSCWISKNLGTFSPWLTQGSIFGLVKSKY